MIGIGSSISCETTIQRLVPVKHILGHYQPSTNCLKILFGTAIAQASTFVSSHTSNDALQIQTNSAFVGLSDPNLKNDNQQVAGSSASMHMFKENSGDTLYPQASSFVIRRLTSFTYPRCPAFCQIFSKWPALPLVPRPMPSPRVGREQCHRYVIENYVIVKQCISHSTISCTSKHGSI